MTRRLALIVPALTALALTAATALPASAHERTRNTPARQSTVAASTIVGVAAGNPDFSTLVAAVQAARLVDTLSGDGPFTVFAPTNAAFDGLPAGTVDRLVQPGQRRQLQRILTYHVVAGRVSAADLSTAVRVGGGQATLKTVQGGTLTAEAAGRGRLRLIDSTGESFWITATDINASNGVVHVIDGVLTPGH
ncbi:fasciclin domain-containing protein [Brevundimonas variabilis]|uniref:Putative surface protein with fasciclin (FAS1) repeats n=1 Tax=Brevundimonas variabilis TaxID=74312 RepID=A0A7W9CJP5_9CAUL|nr:fasciclin domain-containing protein [Brevundimonas variabilis]MBB5746930.1 putative surface protein with fasciclin (FAS1) repeats [Brevundimonas variabilis]